MAGDFNVNINPINNRISQSPPQHDPSRELVMEWTRDFVNVAENSQEKPFLTYYQIHTRGAVHGHLY